MKTTRIWPLLFCLGALPPFAAVSRAQIVAPAAAPVAVPSVQRNVEYGEADGQKLLLDVYGAAPATLPEAAPATLPEAAPTALRPAIILVHGGSWISGSKSDLGFAAVIFTRQGYVSFSIDYRLVRGVNNRFPAQIDDTQRAVRWIRAHAAQYGVDPERIGAFGTSAGGQLVALLGTTDTRDNSDPNLAAYSSRVQCVVDLYGPTDFTAALGAANGTPTGADASIGTQIVRLYLGAPAENAVNYRAASPAAQIDKKTVPFLIFHGGKDNLVPVEQSQSFDAALRAAGIESALTVFPNAGHGYREQEYLVPTFAQASEFFNRHLKGDAAPKAAQ